MRVKNVSELITESDVEQKFLYPLLTESTPSGLSISSENILTKPNIRRFEIDKGRVSKIYFPDIIVIKNSYPVLVIEVKKPTEDITAGFREARLYATELNAVYPGGINPAQRILATNGVKTLVGYWDQSDPILQLDFDDIAPYAEKFAALQEIIGDSYLDAISVSFADAIRPNRFYMPRRLIGGKAVQDEILPKNSFGATISYDINQLFVPETMENRAKIAKHAYIQSSRRTRFIDPIDKLIRAAAPASHHDATLITDTGKPQPVLDKLRSGKELEHKVLLLIGGAGAGKTTFVDYLREVALPADLREKTAWIHFNMNLATVSANEIYNWMRKEIIRGIREIYSDIDFDDLDNIKKIYAVDINKFNKGRGRLFDRESEKYNTELADVIKDAEKDLEKTAINYCRFCGGDRGRLLIFVLDNCDKRTLDEQLLMFSVAQWLKTEFQALVILPLREETYDNHRHQPPLDTALKDLVFRIEPPRFQEVLEKRVALALKEAGGPTAKTLRYELPNSMHVEYPASEQAKYLVSIMASIFNYDKTIGRLIMGLSGRNIRTAFEIFLEICNSGYISEGEIFKIKSAKGTYHIPFLSFFVSFSGKIGATTIVSDHI
ncbi:type I restriction enzyme HsdR N-terminal domain-containing protein [Brucella sp. 10RB9214]|nr:type I restriction enzyme HsdR N-terminal domain-containing protein [Brucella sp. 10RB9214]